MKRVDLNCDIGEGFGAYTLANVDEASLLRVVTSANIACGFHAGDPATMRRTVEMAVELGVSIGAHPGLPDLAGFGRRSMNISPREAHDMTLYQVGALDAFVRAAGARLSHVKPHGALYNMAAQDAELAAAIAEAVRAFDDKLILFGLAGSHLLTSAAHIGLRRASEVFADRAYKSDAKLTSRRDANALITDPDTAARNVIRMVTEGVATSIENIEFPVRADTICIHGDTPGALTLARFIRRQLEDAGIVVRAVGLVE
jgi:UPF0271 protein